MKKEKKPFYKRWYMIVLYVIVGIGIIGSLMEEEPTSKSDTEKTFVPIEEEKPEPPKTFQMGDLITAGDFTWKVTGTDKKSEIGEYILDNFMGDKADGIFLILDVEVTNNGKNAQYVMSDYVRLYDAQDREYVVDTSAGIYLGDEAFPFLDTINPGLTKKGKIVFDVVPGKEYQVKIASNIVKSSFKNMKLLV